MRWIDRRLARAYATGSAMTTRIRVTAIIAVAAVALILVSVHMAAQDKPASPGGNGQVAKAVGPIKSIQTDSLVIAAESGGDVTAKLTAATKILRIPPGEKDLKNATPLQPQDLQPGDRVLVRGQASANDDGHTITALSVVVMKQADVAAKQQHDRDDWQKRGVGGLVTKVDATAGIITVSSSSTVIAGTKSIAVQVAKNTVLRRYAPGSVNFDDAKPAPIDQVKVGDQLRARGNRNPDGSELAAEEIVSGSFRNIAGTIKTIDATGNTMTVQDAISKAAVVVKISSDSQVKKLPPEMAQRIAMRLKGAAGGATGDQPGGNGQAANGQGSPGQGSAGAARAGSEAPGGRTPGGAGGNGPQDFQRLLSRLPNSKVTDLQKDDAVMIVSTVDGTADAVTAITLLAGVDAILRAAPDRSASLLSPWSLNAAGGEGEAAQ
jgi:hypothetical protein